MRFCRFCLFTLSLYGQIISSSSSGLSFIQVDLHISQEQQIIMLNHPCSDHLNIMSNNKADSTAFPRDLCLFHPLLL